MLRSRCCAEFTISMTWKELIKRAGEERAGTRPPAERYVRMVELFEIIGLLRDVPFYRCRRLDPLTMRCMDYADRLPICVRYGSPSSPCTHENCGGAGEDLPACSCFRLQDVGKGVETREEPIISGNPESSHKNPSPKPAGPPLPPPPAPPRPRGPHGG